VTVSRNKNTFLLRFFNGRPLWIIFFSINGSWYYLVLLVLILVKLNYTLIDVRNKPKIISTNFIKAGSLSCYCKRNVLYKIPKL